MNIQEAIREMQIGKKVIRAAWKQYDTILPVVIARKDSPEDVQVITLKNIWGYAWSASVADLLADDWEVVE